MDVNFELSTGTKYKIEVGFFDTVLDMKERLLKHSGVPIKKQAFFFNGKPMDDENDVQFYELWEGSCINVLVKVEAGKIQVHVKAAEHFFLEVDKSDTVKFLKEKIHERIKIPISRLVLFHSSKRLADQVTLGEYGISDQSDVNVMLKPTLPAKQQRTMKIIVEQARTDKMVTVEVKSTDTVNNLKEKLQALGIPADEHFLIHNQSPMTDKKTLEWHGVEEGHVLTIFQGSVTSSEPSYSDEEDDGHERP